MFHSIIIPCRNRHDNLKLCLLSLRASAERCNTTDWEVIVVDDSFPERAGELDDAGASHLKCFHVEQDQYFNKPKLLNVGMAHAEGEVITFLDADAIVAPMFMENVQRLSDNPSLIKLCYRVRHLSAADTEPLRTAPDFPSIIQKLFAVYGEKKIRFEGYGLPDRGSWKRPCEPIFGNSQFSAHRYVLKDMRFDERFKGRGYEDIHFNFLLWKKYYETYRAEIVTDAEHAMYHIENPPTVEHDWGPGPQNTKNHRLYRHEFERWKKEMAAKGIKI